MTTDLKEFTEYSDRIAKMNRLFENYFSFHDSIKSKDHAKHLAKKSVEELLAFLESIGFDSDEYTKFREVHDKEIFDILVEMNIKLLEYLGIRKYR